MPVLLLRLFLVLVLGGALTALIDKLDRQHGEQAQRGQIETQLQSVAAQVEKRMLAVVALSETIARQIGPELDTDDRRFAHLAGRYIDGQPHLLNVTLSRGLDVKYVYPLQGNEAVLGLNYGLRADVMRGVRQGIDARRTEVNGPILLAQNARLGLIVRTPLFAQASEAKDQFQGMLSIAVDLGSVLQEAGLPRLFASRQVAFRGVAGQGADSAQTYGDLAVFNAEPISSQVVLPGGVWQLAVASEAGQATNELRTLLIRGGGMVATLIALIVVFTQGRRRRESVGSVVSAQTGSRRRLSLRAFLLGSFLLVLLPIIVLTGWAAYRNAEQTVTKYTRALAWEMGERIRDRVISFFDIPRQIVSQNVEQARAGLLDYESRMQLMQHFLVQIRQQPQLTFVSMGMADGEYYAASRPPLGEDKSLRRLYAQGGVARRMQVERVDHLGRPISTVSTELETYDARVRPWFKAASGAGGIIWYPAYRYAVNDVEGAYDTLGIGMAAPMYDAQGSFMGVTTADVALSQLSEFLEKQSAGTQSLAFIAEEDGRLLAISGQLPLYQRGTEGIVRQSLQESPDPLLNQAGRIIFEQASAEGNVTTKLDGQAHLLTWQSYRLPQGPRLIIGVILPEARFDVMAGGMLGNILYLVLVVTLFGLLLGLLAQDWIVRPLMAVSDRAARLAAGDWQRRQSADSPVSEVAGLSGAIDDMAWQLQQHNEHLEELIAQRTGELEISESDRRYLLAVASHEFRTPAALIKASLDSLRFLGDRIPAEVASRLENIRLAARRLTDLSNTLLTQERLNNPAMLFKQPDADLIDLLRDALKLYPPEAQVEADFPETAIRLEFDPTQLRIAVQNLIDNALEHNPPDAGPVRVFLRSTAENVEICVADGGSGIPDSEKANIFHRFHNLRGDFTRGVGLFIVHRIAVNHGGEALVIDNQPKGTIMVLRLPACSQSRPGSED